MEGKTKDYEYELAEITQSRNYVVAKSNWIVQKTRYSYSAIEQKAIAYICSKIQPLRLSDDKVPKIEKYQLEYEFSVMEYANMCGIQPGGRLYTELKSVLKKLTDASMWMQLPNGEETLVRWIERPYINRKSGIIRIKLDEFLVPYLFGLKEKYLTYGLGNILAMQSQYSIRLYELLKSIYDAQIAVKDKRPKKEKAFEPKVVEYEIDIDKLKAMLLVQDIKSYNNFTNFRVKVLDIAKQEINRLTDIEVDFQTVTKGRKVVKVVAVIKRKPFGTNFLSRLNRDKENEEKFVKKKIKKTSSEKL